MHSVPYQLKLGADPELFLKQGRKYCSAHGVIPGTKEKPYPVKDGAVQVDGMAVEFNITPCLLPETFVRKINRVKNTLDKMVGDRKLICKPTAHFAKDVWDNTPEEAKILGCEPDYNAWTGMENDPPNPKVTYRTASGHIHIGWTNKADINSPQHRLECEAIVKELDFRLGYPSLLLDPDTKRRELYGKAGAYRPKPYGLEYRVLSNFWIQSDILIEWVFKTVESTLSDLYRRKNERLFVHRYAKGGLGTYNPLRIINYSKDQDAKVFMEAFSNVYGGVMDIINENRW